MHKKSYSFLTIDTTLLASDLLRFRKNLFCSYKNDQLKIIDNKIKANQAQYDLDTLAAKISAYSSGDLRKYEYLTGDDLGYKGYFKRQKFEYSSLAMSLSKAIKSADDAKKPVKNNIGLRCGSQSFAEFKCDAEKFKKIPSIDSKTEEINKFLTKLNKFKKCSLRKSENKEEKDFVKQNAEEIQHDDYYDVYKKTLQ